jgi:hypothetical protein
MKFKGNFGELTLNINGTEATGTYQENGTLKGEFVNNTFKGQWENQGMEGMVEFTIKDNKLEGNWKKGLEPGPMKGKWVGLLVTNENKSSIVNTNLTKAPSEIDLIIDSLKNNFLFQVSLGSKELFHSNLIAWLLEQKNINGEYEALKIFLEIIDFKIPPNTLKEENEVSISREEKNIDLIIKWKENGKLKYVFIENKMKSIPSEKQLIDYNLKIEKYEKNEWNSNYKFLLTPLESAIGKDLNWKNITYEKEILNFLNKLIDLNFVNQDIKLILERYIEFVSNIVDLFYEYLGHSYDAFRNKHYNYYTPVLNSLREIRLHDFILKNMHERLGLLINKKINDPNVEIKTSFTRSTGITDIFYDLKDTDFTIGMQIQGNTLKHCMFSKKNESNLRNIECCKQIVNKKLWFYDFTKNPPELLLGKGKDSKSLDLKIENTDVTFCEYSSGHFIYLSKSLNEFKSESVDSLGEYIFKEYKYLIKNIDEILRIINQN